MKFVSLLLLCCSWFVHANDDLPIYSQVYDVQRDPIVDGIAALALAQETQRLVLIEVGGDWCVWCHKLEKFIQEHPIVKKRLHQTFVLLKVNVSDENENSAFMAAFPPPLGFPHMYITDAKGKILHSQDTAEFYQNQEYTEKNLLRFIDKWQAILHE